MSKSPADVIKSLAEKDVLEHLDTLCEIFHKNFKEYSAIHLNVKLLRHAVESYFLDLMRMKDFHGIVFEDQHKRAAFSMLWIVKAHPVQLHTDANMTEALLVINEVFAIHVGISHLKIDIDDISGK